MSGVRAERRGVNGVLLLDKPSGITSHAAMQRVRRLLNAAKAGHTGTLDPLATGLLPVCLGEATKFSHLLLDADKIYVATIRLGVTTTTGDLEGDVTARAAVDVQRNAMERVLEKFVGDILQTPPMYSAVKFQGRPLYELARAGQELQRNPRKVTIRSLDLVDLAGNDVTVRVACSKGTYIRVLAEDVGRALGCGGCLSALRRQAVGGFTLAGAAVDLEEMEAMTPAEREARVLPTDALVATLPRFDFNAIETLRLSRGQVVEHEVALAPGLVRIYGPNREFLGVGEVEGVGRIAPRRLVSQASVATAIRASIA